MLPKKRWDDFCKIWREDGIESLKNIETCFESVPVLHVFVILALPVKGLSAGDLVDTRRIDAPGPQSGEMFFAKVITDNPNHTRSGEITCRERSVCGGPTERLVDASGQCLNRIERDGSDDE